MSVCIPYSYASHSALHTACSALCYAVEVNMTHHRSTTHRHRQTSWHCLLVGTFSCILKAAMCATICRSSYAWPTTTSCCRGGPTLRSSQSPWSTKIPKRPNTQVLSSQNPLVCTPDLSTCAPDSCAHGLYSALATAVLFRGLPTFHILEVAFVCGLRLVPIGHQMESTLT